MPLRNDARWPSRQSGAHTEPVLSIRVRRHRRHLTPTSIPPLQGQHTRTWFEISVRAPRAQISPRSLNACSCVSPGVAVRRNSRRQRAMRAAVSSRRPGAVDFQAANGKGRVDERRPRNGGREALPSCRLASAIRSNTMPPHRCPGSVPRLPPPSRTAHRSRSPGNRTPSSGQASCSRRVAQTARVACVG